MVEWFKPRTLRLVTLNTEDRGFMNSQKSALLELDFGQEHVVIQRRYDAIGALNDFFIAIWFLIGSCFFLYDSLMEAGTWLFIIGSAQFLAKPTIKLISLIHVKRVYDSNNLTQPSKL